MRSDAQRNRAAIVGAARELFIERGLDVSLEAIAERAGIGIATLYRRFPDRHSLELAVLREALDSIRAAAGRAADTWDDDPPAAWTTFMQDVVDLRVGALVPTLKPLRRADVMADPVIAEGRAEALTWLTAVAERAKAAGLLRPDVSPLEMVTAIVAATRPLPDFPPALAPQMATRLVAIAVAGLRPDGAALPGGPITGEQMIEAGR